MKLIIVRHAEPDYSIDGLTEKGKLEAELLSKRLTKLLPDAFYCSTMGRARRTIEPTLAALGMEAEYCDWLREFDYENKVKLPYREEEKGCWDLLPDFVEENPTLYSPAEWRQVDFIKNSRVPDVYESVCREFDKVLELHGYKRRGNNYLVTASNHKTLVFTCHFGVGAVLISHILGCSPYSVWQHTVLLPSSVTVFNSEERIEGSALFRASSIGDTSHLFKVGEENSFMARFCECFEDDTRH